MQTARRSKPPFAKDRLSESELPRRVSNCLRSKGLVTFGGVAALSNHKIFEALTGYTPVRAAEALALQHAMAVRGLHSIWPHGALVPGGTIPEAQIDRLWEARIFFASQLQTRSRSALKGIIGRNMKSFMERLDAQYGVALSKSIFWYAGEGIPVEASNLLCNTLYIRTVDDLFNWGTERKRKGNVSQPRKNDQNKTVRYVQWWYEKHHPELVPPKTPR